MNHNYLVRQSLFIVRYRYLKIWSNCLRGLWLRLSGIKIGRGTFLPADTKITWPHQVKLGENCRLEHSIYFHYDGIYSSGPSIFIGNNVFIGNNTEFNITDKIIIGNDCLIAAGCRFVDHNHGMAKENLMRGQIGSRQKIVLGNDVWLGCNVVVLKGVCVGDGSVIAAGSVVNKSIPEYEIWGGVPATFINKRL